MNPRPPAGPNVNVNVRVPPQPHPSHLERTNTNTDDGKGPQSQPSAVSSSSSGGGGGGGPGGGHGGGEIWTAAAAAAVTVWGSVLPAAGPVSTTAGGNGPHLLAMPTLQEVGRLVAQEMSAMSPRQREEALLQRMGPTMAAAQLALDRFCRVRTRVHVGSPIELKYTLLTYGVPAGCIPYDDEGNVLTAANHAWLDGMLHKERQRKMEHQSAAAAAAAAGAAAGSGRHNPPQQGSNEKNTHVDGSTLHPAPIIMGDRTGVGRKWKDAGGSYGSNSMIAPSTALPALAEWDDRRPFSQPTDPGVVHTPISFNGVPTKPPLLLTPPSPNDVLLGRGPGQRDHVGNVQFRALVDEYRHRYDTADCKEVVTSHIVQIIKARHGGRFLERVAMDKGGLAETDAAGATAPVAATSSFKCGKGDTENKKGSTKKAAVVYGWREIEDRAAQEKVSLCMRTKRRGDRVFSDAGNNNTSY
jgi:hypothetical protein